MADSETRETARTPQPEGEVVQLCHELIRIDTSNYGEDDGPGERKAAEYVAGLLDEVGIESRLYESRPGRTSVAPECPSSAKTHSSGTSSRLLTAWSRRAASWEPIVSSFACRALETRA